MLLPAPGQGQWRWEKGVTSRCRGRADGPRDPPDVGRAGKDRKGNQAEDKTSTQYPLQGPQARMDPLCVPHTCTCSFLHQVFTEHLLCTRL